MGWGAGAGGNAAWLLAPPAALTHPHTHTHLPAPQHSPAVAPSVKRGAVHNLLLAQIHSRAIVDQDLAADGGQRKRGWMPHGADDCTHCATHRWGSPGRRTWLSIAAATAKA